MVDLLRAFTEAVDKIGLLAVLIFCVIAHAAYTVYWNRQLVNELNRLSRDTLHDNTLAADRNTASNDKLSLAINALAKQQETICKAAQAQAEQPTQFKRRPTTQEE